MKPNNVTLEARLDAIAAKIDRLEKINARVEALEKAPNVDLSTDAAYVTPPEITGASRGTRDETSIHRR